MPIYHQLGRVPRKRHIQFRREDGASTTRNSSATWRFDGPSSLVYHLQHPTQVKAVRLVKVLDWHADPEPFFRHRHFRTSQLAPGAA